MIAFFLYYILRADFRQMIYLVISKSTRHQFIFLVATLGKTIK